MREGTARAGGLSVETRSMTDDQGNSGGAGEPPHRRRMPPPTIDLEATDVSPPTQPTQGAAPDPAPASGHSKADPAAAPPPGETAAASTPANDPPEEPPRAGDAPPPAAGDGWRAAPIWSHAAAGALGAAVVALVAAALWAWLGPAGDRQADANARLARIEAQLGALAHPASTPGTGDARPLDDLGQRLGRIESTL